MDPTYETARGALFNLVFLPTGQFDSLLANLSGRGGSVSEAELGALVQGIADPAARGAVLGTLARIDAEGRTNGYYLTGWSARLGEWDQRMNYLQRALQEGSVSTGVRLSSLWDPLRGDPRFQAILEEAEILWSRDPP